jgi:hypothetical protein
MNHEGGVWVTGRGTATFLLAVAVACAAVGANELHPATSGTKPSSSPGASLAIASVGTALPPVSSPSEVPSAPEPLAPAAVMPDVDYWATPQPIVEKMLQIADVKASDLVYDLGCGDARSLVTAAMRYGAKGVGFDIDSRLVAEARRNARDHAVDHLVRIEQADIFSVDLSPADVIFLYMTPRFNLRMVPQFEKMHRGARIVSHEFEIPGAKPTRITHVRGPLDGPPDEDRPACTTMHTVYLWKMPWQKQWTDWK